MDVLYFISFIILLLILKYSKTNFFNVCFFYLCLARRTLKFGPTSSCLCDSV